MDPPSDISNSSGFNSNKVFQVALSSRLTRGNQRDLAREKAKKKQESQKKSQGQQDKDGNKGLTLEQRKARDAELMRKKQEMKDAQKEAAAAGSSK